MQQGTGDNFYQQGQLLPENFLKAARDAGYDEVQVRVRSQEGYDHSYYFVRLPMCIRGNFSALLTPSSLRFRLSARITFTVSRMTPLFW